MTFCCVISSIRGTPYRGSGLVLRPLTVGQRLVQNVWNVLNLDTQFQPEINLHLAKMDRQIDSAYYCVLTRWAASVLLLLVRILPITL